MSVCSEQRRSGGCAKLQHDRQQKYRGNLLFSLFIIRGAFSVACESSLLLPKRSSPSPLFLTSPSRSLWIGTTVPVRCPLPRLSALTIHSEAPLQVSNLALHDSTFLPKHHQITLPICLLPTPHPMHQTSEEETSTTTHQGHEAPSTQARSASLFLVQPTPCSVCLHTREASMRPQ